MTRPPGPLQRVATHPLIRALRLLDLLPGPVLRSVAAGALALGSAVALIGVSAWLVARASQRPSVVEVSLAVVAVRALGISRGVFRYLERLASHDVALAGLVRLREQCYAALAAAPAGTVARLRRGDLLARLGADVDAVGDTVVRGILPFAVAAVVGAGSVTAVAVLLPPAAVALAAGLALAGVLAPWLAAATARRAQLGAAGARAAVVEQTQALLEHLAELEVAGAVPGRRRELAAAERRLAGSLDAAARPAAVAAAVQALAAGAAVLAALLLGAAPAASGALAPVWLPVVVLLPLAAFEATMALPDAAAELVRGTLAARRVMGLVDLAAAGAGRPEDQGALPAPDGPHVLVARGLACGWPGAAPVVTGLDLELRPGHVVALVGDSGAGKSTLLLTLAGLLPPVAGAVTLDGVDLAALQPRSLASVVSLSAEDAHVFATTVRENLRVAAGDVPDEVLTAALADVGLDQWARALPDGLGTVLRTGGEELSGGERRRLLLARALLTGARVILLDEPAEHLDPASGAALVRLLAETAARLGVAVLLVTHAAPHDQVPAGEVLSRQDGAVVAAGSAGVGLVQVHPDDARDGAGQDLRGALPARGVGA